MTQPLPPIYFYVPPKNKPNNLPKDPQDFWQWQGEQGLRNLGIYDLPIQAYLHLQKLHVPCQLTDTFPEEGIVLAHRFWLHDHLQPSSKVMIVCIRGDRPRHPYSQLHIVQNPIQDTSQKRFSLWKNHYIPHWRQSGLISRDASRGDCFENLCYFGYDVNLIPEMRSPSWTQVLQNLGFNWKVVTDPAQWNDYSKVDAIIAMRAFGRKQDYHWKPASKLYQAWATGVPAILGYESAFRCERKSELDYLEATSMEELLAVLQKLRDNPKLREAIVKNGLIRAKESESDTIAMRWYRFLIDIAIPEYQRWRSASELTRQTFLNRRYLEIKLTSVQEKMGLLPTPEINKLRI